MAVLRLLRLSGMATLGGQVAEPLSTVAREALVRPGKVLPVGLQTLQAAIRGRAVAVAVLPKRETMVHYRAVPGMAGRDCRLLFLARQSFTALAAGRADLLVRLLVSAALMRVMVRMTPEAARRSPLLALMGLVAVAVAVV